MHIPDGFLDARTGLASAALAVGGLGIALRQASRTLPPAKVPLMGLAAAFVFAGQMVNFPIAGGTSGHLMGSTLTAILLGPSSAVVVMASVLIVQCLVFADGGVMALGANLFNMAVAAPLIGGTIYRVLARRLTGAHGAVTAAAFAGWSSTVVTAMSCAGQLAMSGVAPWKTVFPAMTGVHLLIGAVEGFITAAIVAVLLRARPALLSHHDAMADDARSWPAMAAALIVFAGFCLFLAPFACPWPDGLEHVAKMLGFAQRAAEQPLLPAPFADYGIPGMRSPYFVILLAGTIGTVAAFGLSWLLGRMLVPRSAPQPGKS